MTGQVPVVRDGTERRTRILAIGTGFSPRYCLLPISPLANIGTYAVQPEYRTPKVRLVAPRRPVPSPPPGDFCRNFATAIKFYRRLQTAPTRVYASVTGSYGSQTPDVRRLCRVAVDIPPAIAKGLRYTRPRHGVNVESRRARSSGALVPRAHFL